MTVRKTDILRLSAILLLLVLCFACTKEDSVTTNGQDYTTIKITLNTADIETKSVSQGNTINDIVVLVYEIENDAVEENALPVGCAHLHDLTQNGSHTFDMNILTASLGKAFRFFALANQSQFGQIYKARKNYSDIETPLTINATTTYKELTTAIFDAKTIVNSNTTGILWTFPKDSSPEAMPLSGWTDKTITVSDTQVGINLYRAVAKTEFYAKLGTNSTGALVKVESVTIKSGKGYNVPSEGFLFSSASDPNTINTPAIFGLYSNVFVRQPDFTLKNDNTEGALDFNEVNVTSNNATFVGSNFLYENPYGETAISSTTSPTDYSIGTYYMEILYSYGLNDNGSFSGTPKNAVNYIPLPPIVRNKNYKVTATFNINVDGNVTVKYVLESNNGVVGEWETKEEEIDFTYPTFKIWPVNTLNENEYDYSKPTARYNNVNDNDGFGFYFQITVCDKWTVTHSNTNDFNISVYKDESLEGSNTDSYTCESVDYNNKYKIVIYPTATETIDKRTTNVYISYPASWLGGSDELLINSGGGGTLWSESGGERYMIQVTQPAAGNGGN